MKFSKPNIHHMTTIAAGVKIIRNIGRKLREKIKGQEYVIQQVEIALLNALVLNKNEMTVIMFIGPPGVGKSEVVKIVAEMLNMNYIYISLASHSDREAHCHLVGFPETYKGATEGELTGKVMRNPNTIVLFDELGTEHAVVDNVILQLLNDHKMHDLYHNVDVSFEKTIVFFTTNLGISLYNDPSRFNYASVNQRRIEEAIIEDGKNVENAANISQALVSRLAKYTMIPFNKLDGRALKEIAIERKNEIIIKLKEQYPSLCINCDDKLAEILLFSQGGTADARKIGGDVEKFFQKTISAIVENLQIKKKDIVSLKAINFKFNLSELPLEILKLKNDLSNKKVGFFCSPEYKSVFQKNPNIIAEEIKTVDKFSSIDYDAVIIEYSQKDAATANAIFDIAKQECDIPTYIFSFETSFDYSSTKKYIAAGAVDVLYGNKNSGDLTEWISNIAESMTLMTISSFLRRSNKMMSYDIGYSYDFQKDGITANVLVGDFRLTTYIGSDGEGNILSEAERPTTKFADVIGLDDVVEEFKEISDSLIHHKERRRQGEKPPTGVLLVGPPGTGKTLLGRALAGETHMPFSYANAADFSSQWCGIAEQKMHDEFDAQRKHAPATTFIDEVEAFARRRGRSTEGTQAERVLDVFLTEMDGLKKNLKNPVFVMAATNIDVSELDPAFVRRFDRVIHFGLPNAKNRKKLLEFYLGKHSIEFDETTKDFFAERLNGKSPADIEKIVEYTVRKAKGNPITPKDIDTTIEILEFGEEHSQWSEQSVHQTSHHEAGHAIVSWALGSIPIYLTNISRKSHAGYMMGSVDEQKPTVTRQELLNQICTLFGGRAAETIVYGAEGITSGFSGDLQQARKLARAAVVDYGMIDDMLSVTESEDGKRVVESKINELLREQYNRALSIIKTNKALLNSLVSELMTRKSMTKKELSEFFTKHKIRKEEKQYEIQ